MFFDITGENLEYTCLKRLFQACKMVVNRGASHLMNTTRDGRVKSSSSHFAADSSRVESSQNIFASFSFSVGVHQSVS
jgi:hypothetical protein